MRTIRVIVALMLREMSTTYGRSPGGYIWAILEPAAGITLLTLAFSAISRTPAIGTSFPLFYASGLVPFLMYTSTQNKVSKAVTFSRQLLIYPRVTYLDAVLARFLLNALIQIVVATVVFAGIFLLYDLPLMLNYTEVATALVLALMIGLGVGSLNCLLFSLYPVWSQVWGIVNRPAFLASGIFFTFDQIPEKYAQYLWYNPLIHVVGKMRQGVYPEYIGDYVSVEYAMCFAIFPMTVGIFFLRRYHKKILNEL
ncbi:sugar ABC transporter permease (plasmid) [Qingshengfaniella alkalisoli]|uniref:Transport permease protein n=2 Tax=Qingshengfaniella alkalisoli TaxID=2599296 RepID=A0A5B8J8B0_9RHOB|nr:sugar ABC transporter permease [Qingshengfaniella alkalisoli]